MPRVFRASHVDRAVAMRVIEVTTLMRPPQALFTPAMVLRILRASGRAVPAVPPLRPESRPVPVAAG